MKQTGIVFDISHYMLEDGPGIRTNVFLKGCYLRCKWCSNAYGLARQIQLAYEKTKCIGCKACLQVCPCDAIIWDEEAQCVKQDFAKCKNCMKCTAVCPAKARKQIGRVFSVEEVVKEVEKDRIFYRRGGGGITLSGGEILMQPEFAFQILARCREEGFNTTIETSGFGKWEDLKNILSQCDSAFMDCKCMDQEQHRKITGVSNEIILDNISKAAAFCHENAVRLIVRLPLIPDMNDSEQNIRDTAVFADSLPGKPLLNILPYHNFGAAKYETIGKTYETEETALQTKEELNHVREILDEMQVTYSIGGYDI